MKSILDGLNDKQREAAARVDGPLLIIAGAGSGKTRTLTHRIAYMIRELGIKPWNIMAITFTNKAAGEMRERVNHIVGSGGEDVWVMTFHSTCVRMLRRHIHLIGYDNSFTIYDSDDSKSVMKGVIKRLGLDPKQFKESAILKDISNAKNELQGPDDYEEIHRGDFSKMKYAQAYRMYQETLRSNNALDFDDLIRMTVWLLQSQEEVREQYRQRFQYIMVDEYQDTNNAQFELVRLLTGQDGNICVVGDDDQSIYRFRGANIQNILNFEKVFKGAKVVKLEQNYRSTQNILNAANAVIANNAGRKAKQLWSDRESDIPVYFTRYDSSREEARSVVEEIAKLSAKGKAGYNDCAILYRTNAQSREFEEAFVRENVPYFIVGGVNFYARKEIKDVLAYLKTINNAKDDLVVRRIINVPARGIGQTTIQKLATYGETHGVDFFEACQKAAEVDGLSKAAAAKVLDFVKAIRIWRGMIESYGIYDVTELLLEETGYYESLQKEDPEEAEERRQNIDELLNRIRIYEDENPEGTLGEFLEEVALVSDLDSTDEQTSRVLLMTIHSAKGLEFDRVWLTGMEEGLFPSYMSIGSGNREDIEEERRLAYVAITRAKNVLKISAAKSRMVRGEMQYNAVSRFVHEIPKEYLCGEVPESSGMFSEGFEGFSRPRTRDYDPGSSYGGGRYGNSSYGSGGSYGGGKSYGKSASRSYAEEMKTSEEDAEFLGRLYKARHAKEPAADSNKGMAALQKGADLNNSEVDYQEGDRVQHVKYGDGTVTELRETPKGYQVTVNFDKAGQKIMFAAFAKLKKI